MEREIMKKTGLYALWSGMKSRCYNPNVENFESYGGRGIKVCDEWLSFANFLAWARTSGYQKGLTLDRYPDKNGNYEPSNCRWATMLQQSRNTRANRLITHNGYTKCISEWAAEKGIYVHTLFARINARWSIESAIETPTMRQFSHKRK